MEKAKLFKILVVICIILSFLSCIYAASAQRYSIESNNVSHVYEDQDAITTVITASANFDSDRNGTFIFSPNATGVYTIDVSGLTNFEGKNLCYTLTDMNGKEVRLAAYYDAGQDKYITYTDGNDSESTKVDVLLTAGKKYKISLSTTHAVPRYKWTV